MTREHIQSLLERRRAAERHIAHERPVYNFSGLLLQIGLLKAKPA